MTFFDQLFYNIFNHYKVSKYKKSANEIALYYITFVQASILLVLGVFFSEFFHQMNVSTMSSTKGWTLFTFSVIVIYFKNWIQYSGKKRKVLNAKQNKKATYGIWTLWTIPFACLFLAIIFLRVF